MVQMPSLATSKWVLSFMNNLFEAEKKLRLHGDPGNVMRNVNKMNDFFKESGLAYEDPSGQSFKETRTDLEATISGTGTDNLVVVEVIKPIIRGDVGGFQRIIQKGIVVVQAATDGVSE